MDKMNNVFEQVITKKYLVSLLSKNQDWENRKIGFVLSFDDKDVVIQEVDKFGKNTKIYKLRRSKISVIELLDEYTFNLKQINESNLDSKKTKAKYLKFDKTPTKIKRLIELGKVEKVCSFILSNDNYVTGFINEVIEDGIVIQCIGYNGNYDGLSVINFDSLERIRMEGFLEKKITFLSGLPDKRKRNWE